LRDSREESLRRVGEELLTPAPILAIGVGVKHLPPKSRGRSAYIFF